MSVERLPCKQEVRGFETPALHQTHDLEVWQNGNAAAC